MVFVGIATWDQGGNRGDLKTVTTDSVQQAIDEARAVAARARDAATSNAPTPRPPAPLPPAVPQNAGMMWNRTGEMPRAPLEIRTSAGADYFVKLVDAATGRDAVAIFVRGGRPIEVNIPLGRYRMRYASGETWRGETHLFGPGDLTSYSEADSVFEFEISGGYVNGYTVELIRQVGGNLDTRSISPAQF